MKVICYIVIDLTDISYIVHTKRCVHVHQTSHRIMRTKDDKTSYIRTFVFSFIVSIFQIIISLWHRNGPLDQFLIFFLKKSKAQRSSLSTEEIPLVDTTDLRTGSRDENTEISSATKISCTKEQGELAQYFSQYPNNLKRFIT